MKKVYQKNNKKENLKVGLDGSQFNKGITAIIAEFEKNKAEMFESSAWKNVFKDFKIEKSFSDIYNQLSEEEKAKVDESIKVVQQCDEKVKEICKDNNIDFLALFGKLTPRALFIIEKELAELGKIDKILNFINYYKQYYNKQEPMLPDDAIFLLEKFKKVVKEKKEKELEKSMLKDLQQSDSSTISLSGDEIQPILTELKNTQKELNEVKQHLQQRKLESPRKAISPFIAKRAELYNDECKKAVFPCYVAKEQGIETLQEKSVSKPANENELRAENAIQPNESIIENLNYLSKTLKRYENHSLKELADDINFPILLNNIKKLYLETPYLKNELDEKANYFINLEKNEKFIELVNQAKENIDSILQLITLNYKELPDFHDSCQYTLIFCPNFCHYNIYNSEQEEIFYLKTKENDVATRMHGKSIKHEIKWFETVFILDLKNKNAITNLDKLNVLMEEFNFIKNKFNYYLKEIPNDINFYYYYLFNKAIINNSIYKNTFLAIEDIINSCTKDLKILSVATQEKELLQQEELKTVDAVGAGMETKANKKMIKEQKIIELIEAQKINGKTFITIDDIIIKAQIKSRGLRQKQANLKKRNAQNLIYKLKNKTEQLILGEYDNTLDGYPIL